MKKILAIIGFILIVCSCFIYIFTKSGDYILALILSVLIGTLVLVMVYTISVLKNASISNYYERVMIYLFIIAFIFVIILTTGLGMTWIPSYFNSVYLLLGSMMVAAIGFYLNNRLERDRESRKVKRIIYVVNDTIKTNQNHAENLLSNGWESKKTDTLNNGFWPIFMGNIIDFDIDPQLVRDLIEIKELTYNINEQIKGRNEYLRTLYVSITPEIDLFEGYEDTNQLKRLELLNNDLSTEVEKLIHDSKLYLDKYKEFMDIN
ncbi:hypothetical protein Metbo_1853 [Methanobacterium lacus]|uniref:Uncharacterized protein n=1 Tax=Methanobacterium lacus (strain AL-21) TaxID=877455 RepID=F0TAK3_METLA|nr:hypothetical protein Metbo_1853 [Methanobacterium lacus]